MLNIMHQFSTLSKIIDINILRKRKIGDYFSAVFSYDRPLCYTTISDNTYTSSNKIIEMRYLFLSYLHISGKKYRIHSGKEWTATNITIHKMTESIEYNTVLEFTDNKIVIHLHQSSTVSSQFNRLS